MSSEIQQFLDDISHLFINHQYKELIKKVNWGFEVYDIDENEVLKLETLYFLNETHQKLRDLKSLGLIVDEIEELLKTNVQNLPVESILRITISLALSRFFLAQIDQSKSLIESVFENEELNSLFLLNGVAHMCKGHLTSYQGDVLRAQEHYQSALKCFEQIHISGPEKINNIANAYMMIGIKCFEQGKHVETLDYFRKSESCAIETGNPYGLSAIYNNMGLVYQQLADYNNALISFEKVKIILEQLEHKSSLANLYVNMGQIQKNLGYHEHANEYFQKSYALNLELDNKRYIADCLLSMGENHLSLKDYKKAATAVSEAISIYRSLEDHVKVYQSNILIGELKLHQQEYDEALQYLHDALDFFERKHITERQSTILLNLGLTYAAFEQDPQKANALKYLLKAMVAAQKDGRKLEIMAIAKALAEIYAELNDWKEAYAYLELHHATHNESMGLTVRNQAEAIERNRILAEKDKLHQIELAAFAEQKKLLMNIFPGEIADRMLRGEENIAEEVESVTIFFSDIMGFTSIASNYEPSALLKELDAYFSIYDELALKYEIEKIKTIGDSYMAVCNTPKRVQDHAHRIALFARDVLEKTKSCTFNGMPIQIRIGIHTGPVIAGVIGLSRFAFDLWGDSVNIASRLEQTGKSNAIHVSSDFLNAFKQQVGFEPNIIPMGETELKNRGSMQTFLLTMD